MTGNWVDELGEELLEGIERRRPGRPNRKDQVNKLLFCSPSAF